MNKEPITRLPDLDDPIITLLDQLADHILAPVSELNLEPVVSGFTVIDEQMLVACRSLDRVFPGCAVELEAVWVKKRSSPGEWMLSFPEAVNLEGIYAAELPWDGAVRQVSENQQSLLLAPFKKIRKEIGKWLGQWVRARIACEEAEKEVRSRFEAELGFPAEVNVIDFPVFGH